MLTINKANCQFQKRLLKQELSLWWHKVPILVGMEEVITQICGKSVAKYLLQDQKALENLCESKQWIDSYEPCARGSAEICKDGNASNDKQNNNFEYRMSPFQGTSCSSKLQGTKSTNYTTNGIWSYLDQQQEPLDLSVGSLSSDFKKQSLNRLSSISHGSSKLAPNYDDINRSSPVVDCKPVRRPYTEIDLSTAVRAICCGKLGTRRAAAVYGIPRSTLRNKVCKLNEMKRREEEKTGEMRSMPEFLEGLTDTAVFQVNCRRDSSCQLNKASLSSNNKSSSKTERNLNSSSNHLLKKSVTSPPCSPRRSVSPNMSTNLWSQTDFNRIFHDDTKQTISSNANEKIYATKRTYSSSSAQWNLSQSPLKKSLLSKESELAENRKPKSQVNNSENAIDSNSLFSLLNIMSGGSETPTEPVLEHESLPNYYESHVNNAQNMLLPLLPHFMLAFLQHNMQQVQDKNQTFEQPLSYLSNSFLFDSSLHPNLRNDKESASPYLQHLLTLNTVPNSNASSNLPILANMNEESNISGSSVMKSQDPKQTANRRKGKPVMKIPINDPEESNLYIPVDNNQCSLDNQQMAQSRLYSSEQKSEIESFVSNSNLKLTEELQDGNVSPREVQSESGGSNNEEGIANNAKRRRCKRGQYRRYNTCSLMEAVKAVQSGRMSVHKAGNCYGVPHSTLEYKVKERRLQRQQTLMEQKPLPKDNEHSEDQQLIADLSISTTEICTSISDAKTSDSNLCNTSNELSTISEFTSIETDSSNKCISVYAVVDTETKILESCQTESEITLAPTDDSTELLPLNYECPKSSTFCFSSAFEKGKGVIENEEFLTTEIPPPANDKNTNVVTGNDNHDRFTEIEDECAKEEEYTTNETSTNGNSVSITQNNGILSSITKASEYEPCSKLLIATEDNPPTRDVRNSPTTWDLLISDEMNVV